MTSRWLICFSVLFGVLAVAVPSYGGTVAGRVELRDSRDPAVKNRHDFSGVVVSLKPLRGVAPGASFHVTITQKDKTFSPHVLAIPTGTYVDFPNIDPIFHNAFSSYSGQVFDVGLYPPGTSRSVKFTREGVVRVFCNIHSSMSAMIVVLATPYFAISKHDGSFEIGQVAPGEYELRVTHERTSDTTLGELPRRVTVGLEPLILPTISVSEAGYLSIPHKDKYGHDYPREPADDILYHGKRN
jgi:plastocyanin